MEHVRQKSLLARSVRAVLAGSALMSMAVMADTGGLRVKVTDADGQPVAGAKVYVHTPDSLVKKTATTDAQGFVRLLGLDPSENYKVEISRDGFSPVASDKVLVISGKSGDLDFQLSKASATKVDEVIAVTGRRATIDTTSAVVGQDLTLDLVDSLPTGRNYQDYLQLVAGVKPSDSGNPSSKSGVNYSDVGGSTGTSTDNVYYLDGINVTDNVSGVAGGDINSEIIQEQNVITGAVPVEYEGGSGLVSRVTTKSGGNEFHGSVNYYKQAESMIAENIHRKADSYSKYDTAVTLGGPIVEDKLWFFGSFQKKSRSDDVTKVGTDQWMRNVTESKTLGFFKLTGQLTDADYVTLSFFNDPLKTNGSRDGSILNNRDFTRREGGSKYHLEYQHNFDDLTLKAEYAFHKREVTTLAKEHSVRNQVAFAPSAPKPTAEMQQLGGRGSNFVEFRDRKEYKLTAEYVLDAGASGTHTFKSGISRVDTGDFQDDQFDGGVQYTSINQGATLQQYLAAGWQGSRQIVSADSSRLINAIMSDSNPNKAAHLALLDTDHNNTISVAELGALNFNSTAGNPNNVYNVYRVVEAQTAPVEMKIQGTNFYVQDTWELDKLSVNGGVRAEQWKHIDSNGNEIFTFGWDIAPRLSAAYDIHGDGSSKVTAFVGRYYDPIRGNMTDFAGNLSGPVRNEQFFINGNWLTFRVRGGATMPDALIAPTTKTPFTDERLLGFAQNLTDLLSVEFTYTERETHDVLEDYDLDLYTNTLKGSALELPLSYFGYDEMPVSNYVIATLAGGERTYKGFETTFRKRKADGWQALMSYTYNDAWGNTNSDSNADFQGDWEILDPRAPNQWGRQPGNVHHQFKMAGSYEFDFGLELGAVFNWTSGAMYSKTTLISGRHLPVQSGKETTQMGYTTAWLQPNNLGAYTGPAYSRLDLRAKYTIDFDDTYELEMFMDIKNALNNQAAIGHEDLEAGGDFGAFGTPNDWQDPRSIFVGARLSF
ncbi:MAG TPA: TonB-dependent receptor [Rheinheimera sp.]|nr:TonB-dependent receptor [Rheinheimera sp.]